MSWPLVYFLSSMSRKRKDPSWLKIARPSFRSTPIKDNPCDRCKGMGWAWYKVEGIISKSATVQYKELCSRCMGKGEGRIVIDKPERDNDPNIGTDPINSIPTNTESIEQISKVPIG